MFTSARTERTAGSSFRKKKKEARITEKTKTHSRYYDPISRDRVLKSKMREKTLLTRLRHQKEGGWSKIHTTKRTKRGKPKRNRDLGEGGKKAILPIEKIGGEWRSIKKVTRHSMSTK